MKKLLTRAIVAGVLMSVFSVYGDSSNLLFYADFDAADDLSPLLTSADWNKATVAPPSLFDQTPPNGWAVSLNRSTSQARTGWGSPIVGFVNLRTGNTITANLASPASFTGVNAIRFSYDFKCNGGNNGVAHLLTGYDGNNSQVFQIRMGGLAASPPLQIKVNNVMIGTGIRSSSSALPLQPMVLTLDFSGISVSFNNAAPIKVPLLGGANLTKLVLSLEGTAQCSFDYDNFQVWAISKEPPPPRLDLYMLTP